MSPDTWNLSFIEALIAPAGPRTAYRVLPPRHLLRHQLTRDNATADLVRRAVQDSYERETPHRDAALSGYDDALAFVFKYPHLQREGRFSSQQATEATLYAAYAPGTALAERAFHHLRFLREQGGDIESLVAVSQIAFDVASMDLVDLRNSRLGDQRLLDPSTDYSATQLFASAVRLTPAHAIKYPSVRDRSGGDNLALFDYRRLAHPRLDRRRVKDWFIRTSDPATAHFETTAGEYVAFRFAEDSTPI